MNRVYQNLSDLPLTLSAKDIACALNISRAGAYALLHARDFPTLRVGKRLMCSKVHFIAWMDSQTNVASIKP